MTLRHGQPGTSPQLMSLTSYYIPCTKIAGEVISWSNHFCTQGCCSQVSMAAFGAHLLMECSTLMERDVLNLQTQRAPETSMIVPYQGQDSSTGLCNSKELCVLQPDPVSVNSPQADRLFVDLNTPFVGACHACTKMCRREHGASHEFIHGGSLHSRSFSKIVSEHCVKGGPSCWMQVPSEFVHKYLPPVDRRPMLLENANGKAWPVVFTMEHGFLTGWADFSTANQLAIGDFVIFSLVEQAKFVVRVFSSDGCEKRVSTCTPQVNPTRRTPVATQSHAANPAPVSKSFPPVFTRQSRPSESGGRNESRRERDGIRAPPAQRRSCGETQLAVELNTTPKSDLSDPDWQPEPSINSKRRPASSDS